MPFPTPSLPRCAPRVLDRPAGQPHNPINQRLGDQAERIARGIQERSLTNREAARLERGEARIARETHNFRAGNGGQLNVGERAKLRRGLTRSSRNIYCERHDSGHR